ncbi:MAG: phosphonate ABC transporter, permease protein PhnE, partial [Dehalococcoidia bacterium]
MSRRRLVSRLIYLLIAGAAGVSLYRLGLLDPGQVAPAASRLAEFTGSLFPPNTGVLPTLLRAMLETIEIAFVGTLLGLVLCLPLAFLGTRTLFGPLVTSGARLVIGSIRTIPSLLWGVVFVVGFGLG